MNAATLVDPRSALLDRLASIGTTEPDHRALRLEHLDRPVDDAADRRDRDRAAFLLHHLDDPGELLQAGVDHLAYELGTARADAGLLDIGDVVYRPSVVITDCPAERHRVAATPLPNQSTIMQAVWLASGSISFDRVRGNAHLGAVEPLLDQLSTTALLASPIRYRHAGLGLLCLDETEGTRAFRPADHARVDRFVDRHLAPLLFVSLLRYSRRLTGLSSAEAAAVRLLAAGRTYAEIANELGKSPRTIDNQLRSARRKTDTHNAVDLVRWWTANGAAG